MQYQEWYEILQSVQISKDDLLKLKKYSLMNKVFEAIEMLNNIVLDKNIQIKIFEIENEDLNRKNSQLNNENIKFITKNNEQINKINNLKLKISLLDSARRKFDKNENSSMV